MQALALLPQVFIGFRDSAHSLIAIFIYPTFVTSIWIWQFVAARLIIKAARHFSTTLHFLVRLQDVDKKPIQSVGRVAGVLTCVIYLGVTFAWQAAARTSAGSFQAEIRQGQQPKKQSEVRSTDPQGAGACKNSRMAPPSNTLSPCDLDGNGIVDACDVKLAIDAAIGRIPCGRADIDGDGVYTVVDVQRVRNAATKGGQCVVGPAGTAK